MTQKGRYWKVPFLLPPDLGQPYPRNMPARHAPIVAPALALALSATACGGGSDDDTRAALVAGLETAAEMRTTLNLGEVVDGNWDRVLFVCPYEDKQTVDDRLGFSWQDFPGRDDSEGRATFVFASSDTVATWATVGRNLGDPCSGHTATDVVPRAEARFAVEQTDQTGGGKPFYSLVPR